MIDVLSAGARPLPWSDDQVPAQHGRTAVVTGASSGLGLQVARVLARHGASVVLAVRDLARGEQARRLVLGEPGVRAEQVSTAQVDLVDLNSVRRCAAELAERWERLDLLVLNAGISSQPHRLSAQGVESQLATNHLGHFALTGLLLDQLTGGVDPRVITVASALYRRARLDPTALVEDATGAEKYSPGRAYARSKLANVLFARELQRRLQLADSPVRSLVAHPGMAKTPLHDTYPSAGLRIATKGVAALIARPVDQAAGPILFAATAEPADPAALIGPAGRRRRPTITAEAFAGPALDPDGARALWETSERLTGVRYLDVDAPPTGSSRG